MFLPSRKPRSEGKRFSAQTRTDHDEYSLPVQDDRRKRLAFPEGKVPRRMQTKDIARRRENMNQNPVTSAANAPAVQNASAVNVPGTDRYVEPTALPDNEMRLLREQAERQESFVNLLIGLVPFDALIPHEDTCSTSSSKTPLAESPSRGLLRWKQQCLRYDPAVLRATHFCIEQHVRDQEKERESCRVAGHKEKKTGKDVSRTTKQRRQQQHRKPFQRKRTPNDTQLGQLRGDGQRRTEEGKSDHPHARDKQSCLDSKQEPVSGKGVGLQEIERMAEGVSALASDGSEGSRKASVAHVNVGAQPQGDNRTIYQPSRVRGEQVESPRNKHRNTAGGTGFSNKSTNKSTQQQSNFKRHKKSQNRRVRPE